jgi:hypothetical protein
MRLLEYNNNNGELSLTEFFEGEIPRYAILSHTVDGERRRSPSKT